MNGELKAKARIKVRPGKEIPAISNRKVNDLDIGKWKIVVTDVNKMILDTVIFEVVQDGDNMTPRLKLLSALLCLSIVYAVYDYIDRNNIGKGKELQKKAKIKRARTAGTSANSAKVRRIKAREKKLK